MLDEGSNPIFNPCVILKIRKEALSGGEGEEMLYKAHRLAAEKGLPYFANLNENGQMYASYAATGLRFAADWRGDWELDTIRTGNIDSVTLNLPRAHYDAEEDKSKFFENVYDLSEMALRALEMKYLTIRQRAKEGLLPFLLRGEKRDPYSRLENATRLLSFVGLNETVQSITGKAIYESKDALNLAEKIMTHLSKVIKEHVKRYDARFALSMTPDLGAARRLAELDIEKYGLGKVRIQSAGDEPSYTNMMVVPPGADIPLDDRLNLEGKFHKMAPGSHLVLIPLRDSDVETEDLLSTTRKIVNNYTVGLYAYNRDLTYCTNCQRTFHGDQPKCPFCGSVNAVTWFQRDPARYKARRRKRE